MSISKRNKIILLAVTSILVLTLGFVTLISGLFSRNNRPASAATTSAVTMVDGASVRTNADSMGIRFTAMIDHAQLKAENSDNNFFTITSNNVVSNFANTRYRLGMMIVPSFVLDGYEEGTDYINAIISDYSRSKASFAIDFNAGNIEYVEETGLYKVSGALVNLKNGNLNHDYTALVYYSLNDGSTYAYMPLSDRATSTSISDVAEDALILANDENSGVELDDEAKLGLKTIIANAVSMKETGSTDSVSVLGSEVSVAMDIELGLNETLDIGSTFDADTLDSATVNSTVKGAMTYESNVFNPNGSYANGTLSIETAYGVDYSYNVISYSLENETDIETSVTLSDASSISSITYVSNNPTPSGKLATALEHVDGKVTFLHENAYMNDEGTAYGVLDVTRTSGLVERHHVPLWSLFIDSAEDLLTADQYSYKGLYNGTVQNSYRNVGYFKFTADVDMKEYPFKTNGDKAWIGRNIYVYYGWEGLIDGNGHAVINFSSEGATSGNGLVWSIGGEAVIKNIKVHTTYFGGSNNGLITAFSNGGLIYNCEVWCDRYIYPAGASGLLVGNHIGSGQLIIRDCVVYASGAIASPYIDPATVAGGNDYPASAIVSAGTSYKADNPFTGSIIVENVDVINVAEENVFGDPGNPEAVSGQLWQETVEGEKVWRPFGADDGNGGKYGFAKLPTYTHYTNYYEYASDTAIVKENVLELTHSVASDLTAYAGANDIGAISHVIYSNGTIKYISDGTVTTPTTITSGMNESVLLVSGWKNYKVNTNLFAKTFTTEGSTEGLLSLKNLVSKEIASATLNGVSQDLTNNCVTLPAEAGEYTYKFSAVDGYAYKVTVTVEAAINLGAVSYDLKDGINSDILSEYDDTIESITFDGKTLNATDGVITLSTVSDGTYSFVSAGGTDIRNLVTELSGAEILGTSGKKYTAELSLYSLIVNDQDEFRVANKYLISKKGIVKIANDITITSALGITDTNDQTLGQVYGGFNGFKGIVDGLLSDGTYATINYHSASGGNSSLFGGANGCTIKNLNISFANNQNGTTHQGMLFNRLQGATTLENVNISFDIYNDDVSLDIRLISLISEVAKASKLTLKNVVVDLEKAQLYSGDVGYNGGLFYKFYSNTATSYGYYGNVYVDNLIIIDSSVLSGNDGLAMRRLFGGNRFTGDGYEPVVYGKNVLLADGATTGIVIYDSKADYLAGTNAHEVGFTAMDAVTLGTNISLDLTSNLEVDGELTELNGVQLYFYTTKTYTAGDSYSAAGTLVKATNTISFAEVGTYTVYVRDNDYNYYEVIFTVVETATEVVDTEVVTDLKDGIDFASYFTIEEEIASVTIGSTDVTAYLSGTTINFGDVASMPDEIKLLASIDAQSLVVTTLTGTYTLSNVKLWSLIVDDEAELRSMYQYQTSARTGKFYVNADIELTTIPTMSESSYTWDPAWSLGSGIWSGFAGVFDGGDHVISNVSARGAHGVIVGSLYGGVMRNVNYVYRQDTAYDLGGSILEYSYGNSLVENVSVDIGTTYNYSGGASALISYLAGGSLTLKNITVFIDRAGLDPVSNGYAHGLLISHYQSNDYIDNRTIAIDNITVVGTATAPKWRLFGGSDMSDANNYTPLALGNGVVLASGATNGVTVYATREDYTNTQNAMTVSYTELDAVELNGLETLNASTEYTVGGEPVAITPVSFAIATDALTGTYVYGSELEFAESGTYTVLMRDATYNYYMVEVVVDKTIVQTIETAYTFDLKDGIALASLLDAEGNALAGDVTAITIDDVDYTANYSDGLLALATATELGSEIAKSITITTTVGKYTYTDVTIWSIIVSTADEMFLINDYLHDVSATACDGAITFDAEINFSERTVGEWTNEYRIGNNSGSLYNGFIGYIDGADHTISNFVAPDSNGGLIGSGINHTVKNLTIIYSDTAAFGFKGVLGSIVNGAHIEDVSIQAKLNYFSGNAFLFSELYGSNDITLKNVTLKLEYSNQTYCSVNRAIIGSAWGSEANYNGAYRNDFFAGTVYVDNLVIGSNFKATLIGRNYFDEKGLEHVSDYGDGITLAEGATKGITFYNSRALTGTAYEATYENVNATAYAGVAFDFASVLGQGESVQYWKGTVSTEYAGVKYSNVGLSSYTGSYTFEDEGTYKFVVRTTEYKYYHVTINVQNVKVPIETGVTATGDLKYGLDLSEVFGDTYADEVATSLIIGERVISSITDNVVTFDISGANDARDIASNISQPASVITESGETYNFNLVLWSLIVKTEDDLFSMVKYEYSKNDTDTYGYFFINNDITVNQTWRESVTTDNYDLNDGHFQLGEYASYLGSTSATGNSLSKGFNGIIDGNEKTITFANQAYVQGTILYNISNATIKDLTYYFNSNTHSGGLVSRYVYGTAIFDNVHVSVGGFYTYPGEGLMIAELTGYTNVTFNNCSVNVRTDVGNSYRNKYPLIAKTLENHAFSFTYATKPTVVLNNFEVYNCGNYSNILFGGYGYEVVDEGSNSVHKEKFNFSNGASGTITFYAGSTAEDGYSSVYDLVEDTITGAKANVGYDITSLLRDGETVNRVSLITNSDTTETFSETLYNVNIDTYTDYALFTGNVISMPSDAGTYKFYVRTDKQGYYTITFETVAVTQETITTAYEFDLYSGIDTSVLLDSQGNALTNVEAISYGGNALTYTDGFGVFSDATTNNATKVLADAETKRELIVTTAEGQYTYPNVILWSVIVDNSDEFRAMYQYTTSSFDGHFKIGSSFEYDGVTPTTTNGWEGSRVCSSGYPPNAFIGLLDGNNQTISNVVFKRNSSSWARGGLFGNVNGATIKDLNIEVTEHAGTGIFGDYVFAVNMENVTVTIKDMITPQYDSGKTNGILFLQLVRGGAINLKDVTVIVEQSSAESSRLGIIGANGYSKAYPRYGTGIIYLDNFSVVGTDVANYRLVDAGYITTANRVIYPEFGGAIQLADGATKGVTYYADADAYASGDGVTVTSAIAKSITAYTNIPLDLSAYVNDGETIESIYYANAEETSSYNALAGVVNKKASLGTLTDTNLTFTEIGLGTYYVSVRTEEFTHYIFTVSVEESVSETIETAYNFDLKDGFDTSKLLDSEGNALQNVLSLSYGGTVYALENGVASFGDYTTFTDTEKKLASDTAKSLVVATSSGVYTYTNVTLWSILVDNAEELKLINKFHYTYSSNNFKSFIALGSDVDFAGSYFLATDRICTSGYPGAKWTGVFNGLGHTITSFNAKDSSSSGYNKGGLFGNFHGTVKNLTINTSTGFMGLFGNYCHGGTLENVTVDLNGGYLSSSTLPNGILFNELAGSGALNLIDVTIIMNTKLVTPTTYTSIIGSPSNTSGWIRTGAINVDNFVIVGTDNNNYKLAAFALKGSGVNPITANNVNKPLEYGANIVKATSADYGIVTYATVEDYQEDIAAETMDNARIANTTAIALEATAGVEIDFATAIGTLAEGETVDYITYADPVGLSTTSYDAQLSTLTTTSIALPNAGTYTVCIRTNAYNYYIVTVTVA